MSEDDTLLAYLVPKLTSGVEDAATDALAYILNKSEPCRVALVDLVSDGDYKLAPLTYTETQVAPSDTARLDLVGYDSADSTRLIIESKFWAALLDGQASGYIDYLDDEGPAVLLFVAPEQRHEALWHKIREQFESDKPTGRFAATGSDSRMKVAAFEDASSCKRVALMNWATLLDRLETADTSTVSDVRQLKALARVQDDVTFSPLHAEDLSTTIPRRMLDYNRIVNDVVDAHGVREGWMTTKGMKATPQSDGHLRYFGIVTQAGGHDEPDLGLAICISFARWERWGTPLWLRIWDGQPINLGELHEVLKSRGMSPVWQQGAWLWVPITLKTGADYGDVLRLAADQVKDVCGVLADLA